MVDIETIMNKCGYTLYKKRALKIFCGIPILNPTCQQSEFVTEGLFRFFKAPVKVNVPGSIFIYRNSFYSYT